MTNPTFFTVHCPDCGDIDLTADELWLVLPNAGAAHYDFVCPDCRSHVRHEADEAMVSFLGGLVATEELEIPAEALEDHTGQPLTLDDLIDLMVSLEASDVAA